jgi:aminoglycoside/choline kinase family phosphotransferase
MSFAPRPLLLGPGELRSPADPHAAADGMDLLVLLSEFWAGIPEDATLEKLRGDASTRSYYRVRSAQKDPASLVVMRLPAGGKPSELGSAELPFVDVQRYLAQLGLPVPAIYTDASERGLLLLEDLGDETFEARFHASALVEGSALYGQAIDLLSLLHDRTAQGGSSIAFSRSFDRKLLRWELDHFREWGLEALDIALSAAERQVLDRSFDALVDELLALPQGFAHRDYQSRNLMWAARGELVLIDFQDALIGPLGYDLAALLCDSYIALDEPMQLALIERYANNRSLDLSSLVHAFRLVSVQRKLKDAGRFVFIDQVRANPTFLPWYGASVAYAARALGHLPVYAQLADLLRAKLHGYPDRVRAPQPRTGARADALK